MKFSKNTNLIIIRVLSAMFLLFLIFFSNHFRNKPAEITNNIGQSNEVAVENIQPPETIATKENTSSADTQDEKKIKIKTIESGLTIGIIADAHSGQEYGFSRLNSSTWIMNHYADPDITIDLGDLIESRFHYKAIKKSAAIADFKRSSYFISQYCPTYHAIGNHEVLSLTKSDIRSLTGRNNYFSIQVKGYNIIILDANYGKYSDTNGELPKQELGWLKSQLKNNARNIIFIHHPLYNLVNSNEVEDIIKKNKQRIVMIANGHKHPDALRVKVFGGVKNYTIPSAFFQKSYSVAKINGMSANVYSR